MSNLDGNETRTQEDVGGALGHNFRPMVTYQYIEYQILTSTPVFDDLRCTFSI